MTEDDSSEEMSIEVVRRETNNEPDFRKLYSSVNPILFKRLAGKPISFHFIIYDAIIKRQYEELVISFGGSKVENYTDIDGRTALMVEDNRRIALFERPAFKVSYITDCIRKNSLLDIGDYIHNRHEFRQRGFMKIIFWESEVFKTRTLDRYGGSDSDSSVDGSVVLVNNKKVLKNTREMYTRSEKEAILKYILSKKKLEGLRGNTIWKAMERRGVCPRRTYQSMKTHFLKTMLSELDKFEFLSEVEKNKMRKLNN